MRGPLLHRQAAVPARVPRRKNSPVATEGRRDRGRRDQARQRARQPRPEVFEYRRPAGAGLPDRVVVIDVVIDGRADRKTVRWTVFPARGENGSHAPARKGGTRARPDDSGGWGAQTPIAGRHEMRRSRRISPGARWMARPLPPASAKRRSPKSPPYRVRPARPARSPGPVAFGAARLDTLATRRIKETTQALRDHGCRFLRLPPEIPIRTRPSRRSRNRKPACGGPARDPSQRPSRPAEQSAIQTARQSPGTTSKTTAWLAAQSQNVLIELLWPNLHMLPFIYGMISSETSARFDHGNESSRVPRNRFRSGRP